MKNNRFILEQFTVLMYSLKWLILVMPVAFFVGSMVALFLYLLDMATHIRCQYEGLLYLLPFAGVFIVWLYNYFGKNASAGNNLIMDEIHQPSGGVPTRMAPFILVTTVITHLFGGSAGREGTAIQIGGSLAQFIASKLKLNAADTRIILMTGIAAGFGAVFGTPLAGSIFAIEVLAIGRIKYDAILPCLLAAVLSDIVCVAYGIHHTQFHIAFKEHASLIFPYFRLDYILLIKVLGAAIVFGLVSYFFSNISHTIKSLSHQYISNTYLIPLLGGSFIIILTFVLGSTDFLGLGVTTATGSGSSIVNAFKYGEIHSLDWFWKLLFTVITLGMGFKGGEVTPLFFIGATLGKTLAVWMGAPIDLMAALGFIAVFAGATNTPLACTIMGVELFGGTHILYYALACFVAYYFSGHSGIYSSQKIAVAKGSGLQNTKTN